MVKVIERVWWRGAILSIAIVALSSSTLGCSPPDRASSSAPPVRQALATSNGMYQNGLTTNGLWGNGLWGNGLWGNGLWGNGLWGNGLWGNGLWGNGLWGNGLWGNGLWGNGLWANNTWSLSNVGDAAVPGEVLRNSPYARQLLQYIYSCAMPAVTYDTSLDPNDGTLLCSGGSSDCDDGYECSAQGTCVVPLVGGVGLGINRNGSTWWDSGTCDESCQRWVSACVLARTNAYGVHVEISMRAPAVVPPGQEAQFAKIQAALATTAPERAAYTLREGAFYGNIFQTTPVDPPPTPTYTGPATGPIASTPSFYACAGPGSNIPEITKRFCSSQGDQVIINVPGICLTNAYETGVCDGEDATGSIHGCFTGGSPNTRHDEVITVFLKEALAVCGDAICSAPNEDETSCPSDCHPGSWAKEFATIGVMGGAPVVGSQAGYPYLFYPPGSSPVSATSALFLFDTGALTAIAPDEQGIRQDVVLAGFSPDTVDVGGGPLPATGGPGVLVRYHADGTHAWSTRFAAPPAGGYSLDHVGSVVVAPNGNVVVGGVARGSSPTAIAIWIGTFTAGGLEVASALVPITVAGEIPSWSLVKRALAVDSNGDVVLSGGMPAAGITVGSIPLTCTSSCGFVAKISAQGVVWAKAELRADSLVLDASDNIVLSGDGFVRKLCPDGSADPNQACPDGSKPWKTPTLGANYIAVDAAGDVYGTGLVPFSSGHEVLPGVVPPSSTYQTPFIGKLAGANGSVKWVTFAKQVCEDGAMNCSTGQAAGMTIGFDPAGNVILGSFGNPARGAGIDFGVGTFPLYGSNNIFISSYRPNDGHVVWAKHVPTILRSSLLGMAVDALGRVVVSGNYSGSMQVDDHLLITQVPETPTVVDSFVASFGGPSPSDTTPPAIGTGQDQAGAPIFTVPEDLYVQATSAAGAVVFFMPPTVIDAGHAGTSVYCSPRPNTTFPLGTTPVTCKASDPLGNHSSATFSVTVVDLVGPVFSPVASPPPVPAAPSASSAVVNYVPPTATDQVDGPQGVICAPASGTQFAIGKTPVKCTSSDAHGNTAEMSFLVSVVDATPPVLTLPGNITATATSVNGAVVTYTATATDDQDGTVTPTCTPPSPSTFHLGTTTVGCTAVDAGGNTASGSFKVTVTYGWGGVLQPINANGTSVFKLGSTIPVKFQLTGASAGITNAVATLLVTKVSSAVTGSDDEAVSTSAATTGNLFRYSDGQYIFNLATKPLSAGTWKLSIVLGDDVQRTVLISLR